MANIAHVSVNTSLARSRESLLRSAGHQVQTFHTARELGLGCDERSFDALIVGHPLNGTDRKRVYSVFREHNPEAPIIQVVTTDDQASEPGCIHSNLFDGPEVLLALLDSVLAATETRVKAG